MEYEVLINSINKRVREGKFFTKLRYDHISGCEWARKDNLLIFQTKELPTDRKHKLCPQCTILLDNNVRLEDECRERGGIGIGVLAVEDLTIADYNDFKMALRYKGLVYNRKTNSLELYVIRKGQNI